jgi:hypothetical protein
MGMPKGGLVGWRFEVEVAGCGGVGSVMLRWRGLREVLGCELRCGCVRE